MATLEIYLKEEVENFLELLKTQAEASGIKIEHQLDMKMYVPPNVSEAYAHLKRIAGNLQEKLKFQGTRPIGLSWELQYVYAGLERDDGMRAYLSRGFRGDKFGKGKHDETASMNVSFTTHRFTKDWIKKVVGRRGTLDESGHADNKTYSLAYRLSDDGIANLADDIEKMEGLKADAMAKAVSQEFEQ